MDNLEILEKELAMLRRNQKIEKHIATKDENFLHSGELSVVDFIDRYSKNKEAHPTLVEISKSLQLSQATVTVLVNRLIDKGLLLKTPSPENKSRKLVSLTDKGIFQLEARQKDKHERLVMISEYLGAEDTENLTKIITKLNKFYTELVNEKKCQKMFDNCGCLC